MQIAIFSLLLASAYGSTFKCDNSTLTIETPPLNFSLPSFNVSGITATTFPKHACAPLETNLTGYFALVDPNRCAPFIKAQNCLNAGASAVLIRGYRDTFGLLQFYRSPGQKDLPIPVVEIWNGLDVALYPHSGEYITLVPGRNPIAEFGEGPWTFYTIFFGIYILSTLSIVTLKLKDFLAEKHDVMPYLTLSLIGLTCLIRIPILIDPTGMRGVYNWGTIEGFLTLDFSFAVVSALIVAFHWDATIEEKIKMSGTHKRLKIVGFTVSIMLLIIEVTTSVLRAKYLAAMPFLLAKVAIYFILGISVGLYFLRSGRKVLKISIAGLKIKKSLKNRAYLGFGVTICLLLFPITAFLVATTLYDSPGGYFMLRFMASFLLNTATLLLLFMFKSSSSRANKSTKEWKLTADITSERTYSDLYSSSPSSSSSSSSSSDVSDDNV